MVVNKAFVFKKIPEGWPVPGEHLATEDVGFDPDAAPPAGGITVANEYCSFDPFMRDRMRDPSIVSYNQAFVLGEPVVNSSVGKVLKSNHADFAPGDVVTGMFPIAQYLTRTEEQVKAGVKKLQNPHKLDTRYFIGPLGMPGLTAYSSLYAIGQPKKGETIFISAASGAVGQIVGQLAKHEGLKVIGSVGSQAKLDFIVKELGFDGGFNYKEEVPLDALRRLAPGGIDIYFDNVGAVQLEAALEAANKFARFVMCGAISEYNVPMAKRHGIKNSVYVFAKSLLMQGFIVSNPNMGPRFAKEHQEKVGDWIADGSFKVTIDETKGMDNATEGFLSMLGGKNFGKAVLSVKDA